MRGFLLGSGCLAVIGGTVTVLVVLFFLAKLADSGLGNWFVALLVVVALVLWTSAVVRINRIGLFVSDLGVRHRSFLRTRTLPWAAIRKFDIKKRCLEALQQLQAALRQHRR